MPTLAISPRALVAVALLTCVAACGRTDNAAIDTSSSAVANDMQPAPAVQPASVTDQADPAIADFNDSNILAKLESGDGKEVALSKEFASKATDPALRDYMKMLLADHSKAKSDIESLAKKENVEATPPPGDTSTKELADLKSRFASLKKGTDFDTAFVSYAIEDHVKDIADSRAMQAQATNENLKSEIGKDLPVLQKHLDKARELAGKLGVSR